MATLLLEHARESLVLPGSLLGSWGLGTRHGPLPVLTIFFLKVSPGSLATDCFSGIMSPIYLYQILSYSSLLDRLRPFIFPSGRLLYSVVGSVLGTVISHRSRLLS